MTSPTTGQTFDLWKVQIGSLDEVGPETAVKCITHRVFNLPIPRARRVLERPAAYTYSTPGVSGACRELSKEWASSTHTNSDSPSLLTPVIRKSLDVLPRTCLKALHGCHPRLSMSSMQVNTLTNNKPNVSIMHNTM